jgi:hypothetical protein
MEKRNFCDCSATQPEAATRATSSSLRRLSYKFITLQGGKNPLGVSLFFDKFLRVFHDFIGSSL